MNQNYFGITLQKLVDSRLSVLQGLTLVILLLHVESEKKKKVTIYARNWSRESTSSTLISNKNHRLTSR